MCFCGRGHRQLGHKTFTIYDESAILPETIILCWASVYNKHDKGPVTSHRSATIPCAAGPIPANTIL